MWPDASAPARYRRIHDAMQRGLVASAHDLSEGGLAVALAEMVIASRLGVAADLGDSDAITALFSESLGRIALEVREKNLPEILSLIGPEATVIGRVVPGHDLKITSGTRHYAWNAAELASAWKGDNR